VCYKKLLAAHGYREMLVKIEEKLLCTFATNASPLQQQLQQQPRQLPHISQQQQIQQKQAAAAAAARLVTRQQQQQLANGSSNGFKKIKLAKRDSSEDDDEEENDDDDDHEDDMSLLEEIVSFNAPDTSLLINEQEHDKQFSLLDDVKAVKQEPCERPVVEIDESSNSQGQQALLKPFRCTYPGCFSSSTTLIALKKHRRRVHGIRVQKPKLHRAAAEGGSMLYNQLVRATSPSQGYKCKHCDLRLRNQRVLSRHIETVHKLAKFFCTVDGCTHASTRKDNYRLHLKNYHRNLPEDELKLALDMTRDMKPVYVNKDFEGTDEENDDSLNANMTNMGTDSWITLPNFDSEMGC
jgi:hypothetical protein